MTYRQIFELKFVHQFATHELERKFPNDREKILRVALLELSNHDLRLLIKNEQELRRLLNLKESLFKKANGTASV